MTLFSKIKLVFTVITAAAGAVLAFFTGRLAAKNERLEQDLDRIINQSHNYKEAQNEANRKKSETTTGNVADKLNEL
jgi:hypothetical protein